MSFHYTTFIHLVLLGFVALFPVVNPVGSAFIVSPYFAGLSRKERVSAVKKVTFYALLICTITLLAGHWVLELFGLSIPVIQLAGGIMICKIGWEFLASDDKENESGASPDPEHQPHHMNVEDKLFYPITFPITAGAGTIAVLFTLSAHEATNNVSLYWFNMAAILVSVIGVCMLVFFFYLNTNRLIGYIGSRNENIIKSIMAFLIFCVGLQIAWGGIVNLIHSNFKL
jgi:multiple antibiotic resistance protein